MVSIFFRVVIVYTLLSLGMRWMGKRQIGELELSELICTLLISEIAALPIGDPELPLMNALLPILFLGAAEVLLAGWKQKSPKIERALDGEADYLIYQGKIRQKALEENRISLSELLSEMRTQGIGSPADLRYCILESNGKLSMLKKEATQDNGIAHILICDGVPQVKNRAALGIGEEKWREMLGEDRAEDIFLLTADDGGRIEKIRKERKT